MLTPSAYLFDRIGAAKFARVTGATGSRARLRAAPILLAAFAAYATFASTASIANIYSFTDDRGVVHFSNLPHLDKRYRMVYRIPTDANLRPNAWSPKGPSSVDIGKYIPIIDSAARAYGLDPKLVHAVIRAESGYNPNALSPKGAVGMMQLIPATAQRYGVRNSNDPTENIHGGSRYLSDLIKMFNGNVELALAGYNAGENAVIRAGNRIPPYAETMAYVPKVMGFYRSVDLTRF
jgi:soluble lytic murein transglycosylase-like protein